MSDLFQKVVLQPPYFTSILHEQVDVIVSVQSTRGDICRRASFTEYKIPCDEIDLISLPNY